MMELGAKFWLGVLAIGVGIALAAWLGFVLVGWAWYTWGLIGALAFFTLVALLAGWIVDKRDARRREVA
jgi:hypothetical protein